MRHSGHRDFVSVCGSIIRRLQLVIDTPLIRPPDPNRQYAFRRAIFRQARRLEPQEEVAPRSFGLAGQAPELRLGRRFAARGARGVAGRSLLDRRGGQQGRGPVYLCIRSVLDRRPTIRCGNSPLVQGVPRPSDPCLIVSASRRRGLNAYIPSTVTRHRNKIPQKPLSRSWKSNGHGPFTL